MATGIRPGSNMCGSIAIGISGRQALRPGRRVNGSIPIAAGIGVLDRGANGPDSEVIERVCDLTASLPYRLAIAPLGHGWPPFVFDILQQFRGGE
jgi:hypothetical protein